MTLDQLRATPIGRYITDRCVVDGDCYLWHYCTNSDGYGWMRTARFGTGLAHRKLWESMRGPIKARLANRCGNRQCMNLDHWQDVSGGVVIARQYKLGQRGPKRLLSAIAQRAHMSRANVKGSPEKARQARQMLDAGASTQEIAAHFGIAKVTAQRWVSGRAWAQTTAFTGLGAA